MNKAQAVHEALLATQTRTEFTRSYVEYVYQKHGKNLNQFDLLALFEDKALILEWLEEECDE